MKYLEAGIAAADQLRAQQRVSLNLEARKREREIQRQADLARENAWRQARGLAVLKDVEELEPGDDPDPLLETTASMALEYSRIREANRQLLTRANKSGDTEAAAAKD
jgi:hypothetical protein